MQVPFTGGPLPPIRCGRPDDVAAAVRLARAAQPGWAAFGPSKRARLLLALHDRVLARRDEAMDLVQLEAGKARLDAFEEVADCANVARHYGIHAPALLAGRRRQGALPVFTATHEWRRPRGVVGFIVPWNYPLNLLLTDALAALVAGNTAVVRPDPQTTLTALWAHEQLVACGFPAEVLTIVTGEGPEVGPALAAEVDYLMFTGSTATGRTVAAAAAARLIDASLELGGKNPMIVRHDADVETAARSALRACFTGAGQVCVSIERIYVAREVAGRFLEAFVAGTRALRFCTSPGWVGDIGSLVNARQLARVAAHVDDARAKGATIHAGGRARPDVGPFYYEPTILGNVTSDMTVQGTETFGPVVSVYAVEDDAAAVTAANATPYGLNASVWTGDVGAARAMAAALDAGTVNINDGFAATWGSVDAPIGGMKQSGNRAAPRARRPVEVHRGPDGGRPAGPFALAAGRRAPGDLVEGAVAGASRATLGAGSSLRRRGAATIPKAGGGRDRDRVECMATLFVTGVPGFLATALLPRLLRRRPGARAVCLVQPRFLAAARRALAALALTDPPLASAVDLVEGDIAEPRLGLAATPFQPEVSEVFHLAAVYDLGVERALAMRVNVDGTRAVLDFASSCPRLARLHYVSTCYVSGRYPGRFFESDLDRGQAFNNAYEETKFIAELDVRARQEGGMPTTIYRPSIVVGDSTTGETTKYDGPYAAFRWLQRQGPIAIMPTVGRIHRTLLNVVPRDFVVTAIEHLSATADAVGRTYHLADPDPLTVGAVLEAYARVARQRLVRVPLPHRIARRVPRRCRRSAGGWASQPSRSTTSCTRPSTTRPWRARTSHPRGSRCHGSTTISASLVEYMRRHPERPAHGLR